MLDKRTQCGRRFKGQTKHINRPEKELQDFANAHLKVSGIDFWRVPDNSRIKALAGFPDNLCMIKINEFYCLAMSLELKTQTKLHGKQITKRFDLAYQIAQTEEEIERAIWEFRKAAQKLKDILKEKDMYVEMTAKHELCPTCNDGTIIPIVKQETRQKTVRECPTCKFHKVDSKLIEAPERKEFDYFCPSGKCKCANYDYKQLKCTAIPGGEHVLHWIVCPDESKIN